MASCARIEGLIQAYVDEELSPADRVILEQHVSGCPECADELRRHRRVCAAVFECYADKRLGRDLTAPVLENLPEMEMLSADLANVNRRAKQRLRWTALVGRYLPAAAVVVVAALGFMLNYYWPSPEQAGESIGLVLSSTGPAKQVGPDGTNWTGVEAEDAVRGGARFETGPTGTLMVGLQGPTTLKLNEQSRVKIDDSRSVSVEQGEAWLDIGHDGRLFKVMTPDGSITVFGTAFAVRVSDTGTSVRVQRGEVLVGTEKSFANLNQGQQVSMSSRAGLAAPEPCEVNEIARWAKAIAPDTEAERLFHRMVVSRSDKAELTAKAMFYIEPPQGARRWAFTSINVYWQPDGRTRGHCSYDLYVYDDRMQPLFMERIPGKAFDAEARTSVELPVPGAPLQGVDYLIVRLVPDFSVGSFEPKGISVSGMAQGVNQ